MEAWSRFGRRGGGGGGGGGGEPEPFSFGAPLPTWPQGGGFAQGRMCIGELEVMQISRFQSIWSCLSLQDKGNGATFYKPIDVPEGFSVLGHYCQPNDRSLHGYVLVAREVFGSHALPPPLQRPQDYMLVWSSHVAKEEHGNGNGGHGYFWLPLPTEGYKAVGFLVTSGPDKPVLDEISCVRADLTEECEAHGSILDVRLMRSSDLAFSVRSIRPAHRGMRGKGVSVGTFCCAADRSSPAEQGLACLKNVEFDLSAMPNLEQVNAVIRHYGPTVFFHPKETYLPSSVSWFFKNGAALYRKGEAAGEEINGEGTNLPSGGCNDGEYWMDMPDGKRNDVVKHGELESAELYAHVKPALGGTFTDVAMWVFCPFNGPAMLKIGMTDIKLKRTGQHIGDWEHFTLRVSNFTGELWSIYFSQHSGGEWVDASNLEYIDGNKSVVYSSKSGHASYPYPGTYLQGSRALGIGIRNDAARSKLFVDSSVKYQIVAAEYLGDVVAEPPWLQFMREWGPTLVYESRKRVEKMLGYLPLSLKGPAENILNKLPIELSREEGPTGPKEKNNWEGDERD